MWTVFVRFQTNIFARLHVHQSEFFRIWFVHHLALEMCADQMVNCLVCQWFQLNSTQFVRFYSTIFWRIVCFPLFVVCEFTHSHRSWTVDYIVSISIALIEQSFSIRRYYARNWLNSWLDCAPNWFHLNCFMTAPGRIDGVKHGTFKWSRCQRLEATEIDFPYNVLNEGIVRRLTGI